MRRNWAGSCALAHAPALVPAATGYSAVRSIEKSRRARMMLME